MVDFCNLPLENMSFLNERTIVQIEMKSLKTNRDFTHPAIDKRKSCLLVLCTSFVEKETINRRKEFKKGLCFIYTSIQITKYFYL